MNCRDARLRMTGSRRDGTPIEQDHELQKHLKVCPACAREAKIDSKLRLMLETAAKGDEQQIPSQLEMKRLVSARLSSPATAKRHQMVEAFQRLRFLMWRHPARGIALGLTAVLLAFVSLVPFKYTHTLGYDLSLGGVCQEYAENDEEICSMLSRLGLHDAGVDVLGCDSTCSLQIIDLNNREEARLVVAAFESLCPDRITSNVVPVVSRGSSSLLDRANQRLFVGEQGS